MFSHLPQSLLEEGGFKNINFDILKFYVKIKKAVLERQL
jgi:hypothetical protein